MNEDITKKEIVALEHLCHPSDYGKSFSRGMRVDLAGFSFLFISGTASVDENGDTYAPGNFGEQVKRTYENITGLLKSENAGWSDVVQTRCYLKDMSDYKEFNQFRNKFYAEMNLNPFPASVGIQATLCRPELAVEIEALAIIKNPAKT